MPKAIQAARHAVALDSSLAEAHCALAVAALIGAWNKAEAEHEFLCALQLNPKYIPALCWYGILYLQYSEGRLAEGMEQAKLALASDPVSAYAHAIYALTCIVAGKTGEGVEVSRRAVQLDPESFLANGVLQAALLVSGQFEASVAAGEATLAMSGRHPYPMAWLVVALADWGKATEAEAVYGEMQARACREYVTPTVLAIAACAVAREDEAIRYAREAYEIRDPNYLQLSRYFPMASRLYRYPRFCEIIAQMGHSDWLRDQPPLTATQEPGAQE
jgi:tetratricopeptide (TPR) repeat protein